MPRNAALIGTVTAVLRGTISINPDENLRLHLTRSLRSRRYANLA